MPSQSSPQLNAFPRTTALCSAPGAAVRRPSRLLEMAAVMALMLLATALLPGRAAAQSNLGFTPRQVAETYMAAVKATNWPRAVVQMHPQSLAVIHKLFIDAYEESPDKQAFARLYGVDNAQAFRNLTPEEFFIRFMSTVLGQDPNFHEAMRHIQFNEVLISYTAILDTEGSVVKDNDTMVLRNSANGWKIYSTPDLEPLLEQAAAKQNDSGQNKNNQNKNN